MGIGETKDERNQTFIDIAQVIQECTTTTNSNNNSNSSNDCPLIKHNIIQEIIIQPYSPGGKDSLAKILQKQSFNNNISNNNNTNTNNNMDGISGFTIFDVVELPNIIQNVRNIITQSSIAIQIPPNLILQPRDKHALIINNHKQRLLFNNTSNEFNASMSSSSVISVK